MSQTDAKMIVKIWFDFDPEVGSVTRIKARSVEPNDRGLIRSKTVVLYNKHWTYNEVMDKKYMINFTGSNHFRLNC